MKKKYVLGVLVAVLCVAPFASSALTTDDVQTRIKELLAKIAELTMQINVLKSQVTNEGSIQGIPAAPSYQHRICNLLNRNLATGVQGDDVRGLQEFLQSEKFLAVAPTGYFGTLTADALRKWQASQGVESVGTLGPKTRERIKIWCGGGNDIPGQRFSATPIQGAAPLSVTFNTWLSGFRVPNVSYVLDFGDGTSERPADCNAPADACVSPGQNTHTYGANGTYTATLTQITDPCAGNTMCKAAIQSQVVGKLQIVVGPVACTKEYKPVCGSKPIVCITTPCDPIQTTYGNTCMMKADGATLLYEGQCRTDTTDPSANPQCKSWYDGCNSCSRSTPGGPAMCTLKACVAGAMTRPYCTGYFGDATHKTPTISGFSGPTNLKVNETGTWTVKASDPEGQELSYNVSWGDEGQYTASGIRTSLPVFTQTSSFTHTYSLPGTYTVSVSARDSEGKEAKVSITVKVSGDGIACTMQYDPICGRPSGCANTCTQGMVCTMECRLHDAKTYSNKCSLDAAGAEYLYAGECQ